MLYEKEATEVTKAEAAIISRRSLMQGAVAVVGGAMVSTIASAVPSAAESRETKSVGNAGQIVSASIHSNVAETESGKVCGYESEGIVGFKGIPYGGSTEGKNRFMPPTKPTPWTGVRPTKYWGWVSPQPFTNSVKGRRVGWTHDDEAWMFEWEDGKPSEDCLRLNVWTPALDNKKRPVIFWIHGGGFYSGSSYELMAYEGTNLAKRGDVVVVSMNHRLGPVGYMNLSEFGERYTSSANAGMLDIVAALEWVKTNVSNFGGDPSKVMIFGQSGGGRKVSTLLGMPAAKGLFRAASIQSSDPYSQGSHESTAAIAAAVVKELGLSKETIGKIHDLPVEAIVEAGVTISPENAWISAVDGKILPRHTWEPSAPESSADVPVMFGSVLNEMANSVQMGDASLEDISTDELKRRMASRYKDRTDAVIAAIQHDFPNATPFQVYSRAAGVAMRLNLVKAASAKAAQGTAPAYLWLFQWQTPLLDGRPGAFHTAELPFVFYNTERCQRLTGGGPVPMALAAKVSDAWINFARNCSPSHPGLPEWPTFSTETVPTMVFDNTCEVKHNHDEAIRKAMVSS